MHTGLFQGALGGVDAAILGLFKQRHAGEVGMGQMDAGVLAAQAGGECAAR